MWKIAPWLCAGIVIGVGLVSMSGDHSTAQPLESSRYTNPACAYAANASTSTSFICVADLDGNGQKEIIVGQDGAYSPCVGCSGPSSMSYVNIIDNSGAVRQQICWVAVNGTGGPSTAECPPITASANAPR